MVLLASTTSELGTNFTGTQLIHCAVMPAKLLVLSLSYHHVFALREVPLQCTPSYTTRVKSLSSPSLLLQPVRNNQGVLGDNNLVQCPVGLILVQGRGFKLKTNQ